MQKIIRTIMAVVLVSATFVVMGCHTANGFGQDVQSSGKAIQKAAN